MRLRSLLVCPCWRCREAREEERRRPTPEQLREAFNRLRTRGYIEATQTRVSAHAWRDLAANRASEWPDATV